MSKKYFLELDSQYCVPRESIIDDMLLEKDTERVVYEAKREVKSEYSWCKMYGDIILKDESPCGSGCEHYEPRNGTSGACQYLGYTYTPIRKVIFKINEKGNVRVTKFPEDEEISKDRGIVIKLKSRE